MSDEIVEQLVWYNRLYKEMDELYHDYAKGHGLSDSAFWMLYSLVERMLLKKEGAYTQKELCDDWSFSRQTINSALKSLEKQGIIMLAAIEGNRKNKEIVLTEQGKEIVNRSIIPLMGAERAAFGRLGDSDRDKFLQLTQKHMNLLKEEVGMLEESNEQRENGKVKSRKKNKKIKKED